MTDWEDIIVPAVKHVRGSEFSVNIYQNKKRGVNLMISSGLMRKVCAKFITYGYSKKNNAIIMFFDEKRCHPTAVPISPRGSATIQTFLNSCALDKNKLVGKYQPEEEIISAGGTDKIGWVVYLNKKIGQKEFLQLEQLNF